MIKVISAYITAGDRLHLYFIQDRLQERALYSVKHSVWLVEPRHEPALVETGNNLGAMTLELKPAEFIHEFVSEGRKTMRTR